MFLKLPLSCSRDSLEYCHASVTMTEKLQAFILEPTNDHHSCAYAVVRLATGLRTLVLPEMHNLKNKCTTFPGGR